MVSSRSESSLGAQIFLFDFSHALVHVLMPIKRAISVAWFLWVPTTSELDPLGNCAYRFKE